MNMRVKFKPGIIDRKSPNKKIYEVLEVRPCDISICPVTPCNRRKYHLKDISWWWFCGHRFIQCGNDNYGKEDDES